MLPCWLRSHPGLPTCLAKALALDLVQRVDLLEVKRIFMLIVGWAVHPIGLSTGYALLAQFRREHDRQ